MPIFSFIQTKGGTGKTTLAQCLSYSKAFGRTFGSICLAELDPQGTLAMWHRNRSSEVGEKAQKNKVKFAQLLESEPERIREELTRLAQENEALVLDVPGESVGKFATRLAAVLSDLSFIPMRSSTNDEQSFADHILPIIAQTISADPDKKKSFFIVPTFVHPQTRRETVKSYFREIMPELVGCLDSYLPMRSVFENFSRDGLTLSEYAKTVKSNARQYGQAMKAVNDIEAIARNILSL